MINQITSAALNQQNLPLAERSDVKTSAPNGQPPSNTSFSPESSLRIINDKIIDGIDKELAKTDATPIRELNSNNFTPESVAKGILGFVQNAINRAKARGQSTDGMLEQAKTGIENGFKQAKDILISLNALSGQIAETVQQTYDLIQLGLDKMGPAPQNGSTVNTNTEITSLSSQTQHKAQSFELNIKTQDGDNIKLSVSQDQSNHQYNATLLKGNTTANINQTGSRSSSNIQLSISGNLDKAEIAAIEELLTEVKAVSEHFFDGDVNAAFEAGLSLGFNTPEIASFALDLNESQTQTASRAYREVNSFGTENNRVSPTQLENLLKPAHDFMSALSNDFEKSQNSDLMKNSSSNPVEGLFNYFSRANPDNKPQIQSLESLSGGSFENITQQLISTIS
ncbi:MAG: DUF5610 domain-containing protein [Gammaproteobacteria bacterium]|nr:DUF5610 domain-containing protein [Gammaproteobacteria bacterium]